MKRLILLILVLYFTFSATAQKTAGQNYTFIGQRYEWLAGLFQALGLPAGAGPAAFKTGQEMRAGAVYYDSVGVEAGLYIFNGLTWELVGIGITQQALDDTAAAIRADFPSTAARFGVSGEDVSASANRAFDLLTRTFTLSGGNTSGYYFINTATSGDRGLTFNQNLSNIYGNEADASTTNAKLTTSTNPGGTHDAQTQLLTNNSDSYSNEFKQTVTDGSAVTQIASTHPTQGHRVDVYGNKIDIYATTGNMNLNLTTLPNKVSMLSSDSLLVINNIGKTFKISKSDFSSSSIWNGTVIGTTFSAVSTTINSGALQWTFTGAVPQTFTLPPRTSSVNQFYFIKNISTLATLTIAADGTDDIFLTSSTPTIDLQPGESILITGAASGTSDLWTALFYTSGISANVTRTFGAIPLAYISSNTLVLKDIGGAIGGPISVTTPLSDSINRINFNTTGTPDGTKFLRDDYSWQTVSSGSTITISSSWFVDTMLINGVASTIITPQNTIIDEFISATSATSGSTFTGPTAIGTGTNVAIGNTLGTLPTTWFGGLVFQTGSTSTGAAAASTVSPTQARLTVDTTKKYRFETVIQLPVLSTAADSFRVTAGFTVYTTNYTIAQNDIHFRYSHGHNSGAWTCYNNNTGGGGTVTNTAVTVSANTDYRLGIEFDGEQILFYINGTLVATHTTTLPAHGTSMMPPVIAITKTGGSTGTTNMFMYADWLKFRRL